MSLRNIVIVIALAVLSIGILSISLGVAEDDDRIAQADKSIDDLKLTLTRGACFGTCPVYTLSIASDGSVRFEGIDFTDAEGVVESTLSHNQMSAIADEIVRSDFFGYRKDERCAEYWTDHAGVKLEIRWHGRESSRSSTSSTQATPKPAD